MSLCGMRRSGVRAGLSAAAVWQTAERPSVSRCLHCVGVCVVSLLSCRVVCVLLPGVVVCSASPNVSPQPLRTAAAAARRPTRGYSTQKEHSGATSPMIDTHTPQERGPASAGRFGRRAGGTTATGGALAARAQCGGGACLAACVCVLCVRTCRRACCWCVVWLWLCPSVCGAQARGVRISSECDTITRRAQFNKRQTRDEWTPSQTMEWS